MPGLLPDKPVAVTRINPKVTIIYGKHKTGKTEALSQLRNCLTLAFEPGVEMYAMQQVRIVSTIGTGHQIGEQGEVSMTYDTFKQELINYAQQEIAAGKTPKPPYKFIAVDTLDALEDQSELKATYDYANSTLGKKFDGRTVLELPNGGGYYYLRNEVMDKIKELSQFCKYLILICHVRDKNVDKGGIAVSVQDLSLAGRLSSIVCAYADAIGYVYRDGQDKPMTISFATSEGQVMGSRMKHLAGKTFPFDWKKIYLDEPDIV